ncbi:MAG TPA: site-2 protease family protein [Candidatus Sulfotelmatobacter sp.]|jgi:Zn-dependent protease|nr:site-2 protease family protein [Candidatus Sulfotelmatobacter sp.]
MDIYDWLIQYLMLIALLTFHEYGHAWMAGKCGDDTARLMGRLSLNPVVHIDPVGTVLIPFLQLVLPSAFGGLLLGGAKPVPVNVFNLRHRDRDDVLVTLAGPGMNLILGILPLVIARILVLFNVDQTIIELLAKFSQLSFMLCFFNLLMPIPPLDGSRIVRVLIGMSHEQYFRLTLMGFVPAALVWQIPIVRQIILGVTDAAYGLTIRCLMF